MSHTGSPTGRQVTYVLMMIDVFAATPVWFERINPAIQLTLCTRSLIQRPPRVLAGAWVRRRGADATLARTGQNNRTAAPAKSAAD